jgi:hypothetical protein
MFPLQLNVEECDLSREWKAKVELQVYHTGNCRIITRASPAFGLWIILYFKGLLAVLMSTKWHDIPPWVTSILILLLKPASLSRRLMTSRIGKALVILQHSKNLITLSIRSLSGMIITDLWV